MALRASKPAPAAEASRRTAFKTMGTFTCNCGNVIRDSRDTCPHAGAYWSDEMWSSYTRAVARDIADYFTATATQQGQEWLAIHALTCCKTPEDVIDLLLTIHERHRCQSVYTCPECGRMHLQRAWGTNDYTPFRPDY